ncbi:hypothetical protein AMEX_G18317 [Astyanax mexicanus]|uniref:Replication protein A OB domain-containing protein n=1 Tax=Astyanax mexicanus TaxID=7994 RepID=A0A8T2L783_ASTMX|nr:hypothetical protein AMEX_G18317 [Astyanax mexicanus]
MGEHDIIAGVHLRVCSLRNVAYPLHVSQRAEDTETKTIGAILASPVEFQRVHVTLKVMEEWETGKSVTRAKKTLTRTMYAVTDKSGSLCLTVWGEQKLSTGKRCVLRNLSVRMYLGKVALSTTAQTSIEEVPDAEQTVAALRDNVTVVGGDIVTANVVIKHFCPGRQCESCHIDDLCQDCGALVKNGKMCTEVKGEILIVDDHGEQQSFLLGDQVFYFEHSGSGKFK